MHDDNAHADKRARADKAEQAGLSAKGCKAGRDSDDGDETGEKREAGVVALFDGRVERGHADEVHRPDAAAERDAGHDEPEHARAAFGRPHAFGHVERAE